MISSAATRGLNFSYFLSMSALGFILPFMPLYLAERGVSDQVLGLIWALSALTALLQLPIGKWSDQPGRRRFILIVSLSVVALAGLAVPHATSIFTLGFFVILFSEHGIPRSLIESMSGAEVRALAREGEEGRNLSALRICRPAGIILITLLCGWLSGRVGLEVLFNLVVIIQLIAAFGFLLMTKSVGQKLHGSAELPALADSRWINDKIIWLFVAAIILYHACNAPQGIYFGLFLARDLGLGQGFIAITFFIE